MQDVMAKIAERVAGVSSMEVPPKSFQEMKGEILEYEPGRLTARFPVQTRYRNPFGFMQGGFVVAAVDNAIGLLSLLEAEPSVTTQLNTTYIRPIGPKVEAIVIEARVVAKTRGHLYMEAEVAALDKLCVRCFATFAIVDP